jgi:hypothetical protein
MLPATPEPDRPVRSHTAKWLHRLPVVTWLAPLVTDAMIAAPHAAHPPADRERGSRCPATPSSACSTGR